MSRDCNWDHPRRRPPQLHTKGKTSSYHNPPKIPHHFYKARKPWVMLSTPEYISKHIMSCADGQFGNAVRCHIDAMLWRTLYNHKTWRVEQAVSAALYEEQWQPMWPKVNESKDAYGQRLHRLQGDPRSTSLTGVQVFRKPPGKEVIDFSTLTCHGPWPGTCHGVTGKPCGS